MSRTTLYAAYGDGVLVGEAEFQNSHGSAAFIWRTLCRKYEWRIEELLGIKLPRFSMDCWEHLWQYERKDGPLRAWEYNCLISTYDHVVVVRPDMLVLADSMERFEGAHAVLGEACSLGDQARAIRKAHEKGARAIAWQQTSVGDDMWWVAGDDEDEDDEGRHFNLKTDKPFWIGRMSAARPDVWTGGADDNRTKFRDEWREPREGWLS